MRVHSVSFHDNQSPTLQASLQKGSQDFQRLEIALKSGDLPAAQRAMESFQQVIRDIQRIKNSNDPPHSSASQPSKEQPFSANTETGIGLHLDVFA